MHVLGRTYGRGLEGQRRVVHGWVCRCSLPKQVGERHGTEKTRMHKEKGGVVRTSLRGLSGHRQPDTLQKNDPISYQTIRTIQTKRMALTMREESRGPLKRDRRRSRAGLIVETCSDSVAEEAVDGRWVWGGDVCLVMTSNVSP